MEQSDANGSQTRVTAAVKSADLADASNRAVSSERNARDEYLEQLRKEIDRHRQYFVRQIRLYRYLRVAVIVAAGAVPVLATVPDVPRWALGVLGAIAAAAEALQQLFQYRRSALQAMVAHNDLERELRLYLIAAAPYISDDDDLVFQKLTVRVERIRRKAEAAFLDAWQRDEQSNTGSAEASEPEKLSRLM